MAFLTLGSISLSAQSALDDLRVAFISIDSREDVETLIDLSNSEFDRSDMMAQAYRGASQAMMAEYVKWPGTKLKHFNQGTQQLDEAIDNEICCEKIWLRSMLQLKTPAFLGYSKELKQDLEYLSENMLGSPIDDEYRARMLALLDEAAAGTDWKDEIELINSRTK